MSQENVGVVRGVRISLPPVREGAGQDRTLDERLSVRFPALFRVSSAAVMSLPTRSRVRRLLVARRVSQTYAAVNRRDFDVTLGGFDPEIEYRPSSDLEEILDFGDTLLVTAQQRGHGSGSGVAVSKPIFQLFKLRRGLVVSPEDFLNQSEALEAAGLRE
jgi:hypothetical protein